MVRAVANLPQGALVLPGFDFDMPDFGWNSLTSGAIPDEDHPQYRYAALLGHLGLRPTEVSRMVTPDTAPDRGAQPAGVAFPATGPGHRSMAARGARAFAAGQGRQPGLSLIEAQTPRDKRRWPWPWLCASRPCDDGRAATLDFASDRTLARRVTAALDRWGIRPDDSAGRPLHLTAPGRLLRHVAALFGRPLTAEALLVLLKHPADRNGRGRGAATICG